MFALGTEDPVRFHFICLFLAIPLSLLFILDPSGSRPCSSFFFFSYCLRHGILYSCLHAMRDSQYSHSTQPANHDPSQHPPHPPSSTLSVAPQPWLCHRSPSLTCECLGIWLDISGHRAGGRGLGHLRKPKFWGVGQLEQQDAKRRSQCKSCTRVEGIFVCGEERGLPAGIQRHS